MREPATGHVPHHARAPRPILRAVYRGRADDQLVLVDDCGRAILLRGDGATLEESIAIAERARRLLGQAS